MAQGIKNFRVPGPRYPAPGASHLTAVDPLPTIPQHTPAERLRKLGRLMLPPALRTPRGVNEDSQLPL